MGTRRIQHKLERLHACHLGLATIQKVLQQYHVVPLQRSRRELRYRRYERPTPGDRVLMDTCKIGQGLYQ